MALRENLNIRTRNRIATTRIPGYRHPISYRTNSSDPLVIKQVFLERQYECVGNEPDVQSIIDCGANIGLATFYLLHKYPTARAIVIEPDAGNMTLCRRNLAPFQDRITFVEAGVWSAAHPMVVERGSYRDGAEWAFQVRPVRPGEVPDFHAVTIPQLYQMAGGHVDVLKIDVEGAELDLFRYGDCSWLGSTRSVAIELHDKDCESVFFQALAGYRYERETAGELTVCHGLQPLKS